MTPGTSLTGTLNPHRAKDVALTAFHRDHSSLYGQELPPKNRIVITPSSNPLQKPAGEQISLLCYVDGQTTEHQKPGLVWVKHGGLHRTGNVDVQKLDAFTISLTITNATAEDSGVYTCQAQLNESLLQKTVDVVIFEDYHFVDKSISTGPVMATAAINISCEVKPKSEKMRYVWSRIGHSNWAPSVKHRLFNNGAILEISAYDPIADAGDYACKVFHPLSGSTIYRRLTVGSELENKKMFCTNMCTNVCTKLYFSQP